MFMHGISERDKLERMAKMKIILIHHNVNKPILKELLSLTGKIVSSGSMSKATPLLSTPPSSGTSQLNRSASDGKLYYATVRLQYYPGESM